VHVTYHGRGHGSVLHGPWLIASVAGKTTTTVVEERNNGLRLCLSCVTNSRTALAVIKNRRVNYLFIYYNVVHSVQYKNTKVKHKKTFKKHKHKNAGVMTLVTCRLTAKNRDQLRNPTLVIYLFIMTSYTVVQYKNTKAKT